MVNRLVKQLITNRYSGWKRHHWDNILNERISNKIKTDEDIQTRLPNVPSHDRVSCKSYCVLGQLNKQYMGL